MNVAAGLPVRHRLRAAADAAGIRSALGGPLPHGRMIEVLVREGRVLADRDVSGRWRGRLLIAESPAALEAGVRGELHAAALAIGDGRLTFVLDQDGPLLVGLGVGGEPWPIGLGVHFTAQVRAGEPARGGEAFGRCTRLALPAGVTAALARGDVVRLPTGSDLATITGSGGARPAALAALRHALDETAIDGVPTNLQLLRQTAASPAFAAGLDSARAFDALSYAPLAVDVIVPGTHTTVQDAPGRLGYWAVGVPPSGPMDDLAFRLANRLVGNPPGCAGFELTLVGPTLRFHVPSVICLAGPPYAATLDGARLPMWQAVAVPAGAVLRCGVPVGPGCRAALAVRGGVAVPDFLGSRATFDLGGFGGHAGRPLMAGDLVPLARRVEADEMAQCPGPLPLPLRPTYGRAWLIGVLEGPHAAPEFFLPADMRELYAAAYTVHHNSNRTGVRLIGPKPRWARSDGGEAGLHPSNLHDNAYAVGAIDFTGDMPILLGPDGPSCGGFVCPAVVVAAERWKLGQLRPGDRVRFARLTPAEAERRLRAQDALVADLALAKVPRRPVDEDRGEAVIARLPARGERPEVRFRRAGDEYLLVEYGPPVLDLGLRLRAHLLDQALSAAWPAGVIDVTPGIRSLQVHHDPRVLPQAALVDLLAGLDEGLGPIDDVVVPSRIVHLPLSWDDPATQKAIAIYLRSVNPTAPWCPSNLEFIRRINGLASIDEVREIVFAASYLVLGLGDVYLGAPVATPLDPRHRLVTTKYNPARTWTPENAVGIGGAYMCVYGMEGPGGYQFVGRTVPVWNAWKETAAFAPGLPWLLRPFDQIRFFPVAADELPALRRGVLDGSTPIRIEPTAFRWRDYQAFLAEAQAPIAAFRQTQRAACAAERQRWEGTASAAAKTVKP